jgi:high affinity Mn2+ porin
MSSGRWFKILSASGVIVCFSTMQLGADEPTSGAPSALDGQQQKETTQQFWNWHVQNTAILQGDPAFPAQYSGPNSLDSRGEIQETVSLDLYAGVRLWRGAEAHVDGLMWQGFGLSTTHGVESFPNGEAFRLGTWVPNVTFARLFIRQTIGFGGEQESVDDGPLQLAGKQDISRLTITVGKMSAKDIFDNNAYANAPRTQFMGWALMANEAWDYPADSLGFETGIALELNQPTWSLRYGFFQMPSTANGMAQDDHYLEAWGMMGELERRFAVNEHPGAVRFLAFLNSADMGSYQEAVDSPVRPADIEATRAYRYKYGFGLNVEQEIVSNIGAFARLGWSDGHTEAWVFSDVDHTATLGVSIKGAFWDRPNDTYGLAGVLNGITPIHQQFFQAQGLGILAGDGALNYGWEKVLETYYDFQIWNTLHGALDYQFVSNPAFNRDRGPASIFAARLHWSF